MEKELVEIIKLVKSGMAIGGDKLMTEFPKLCQQILTYGLIVNGLVAGISFLILLTIIPVGKRLFKWAEDEDMRPGLVLLVFYLIPLVFLLGCFFDCIKIIISPNLYLLEYLKGII